jgi:amino acid permease
VKSSEVIYGVFIVLFFGYMIVNMRRSYRRYEQGDARRNREAEQQREDYLARTQAIENCASALYEIAYRR